MSVEAIIELLVLLFLILLIANVIPVRRWGVPTGHTAWWGLDKLIYIIAVVFILVLFLRALDVLL